MKSSPEATNPEAEVAPQFQVAPQCWEGWLADPAMRREIERFVETRMGKEVQERVSQETEKWKSEAQAQGKAEGLEKGITEAKEELAKMEALLSAVVEKFLKEQKNLIRSHEKVWGTALGVILRRFLVHRDRELVDRIKAWVSENVEEQATRGQVKVFLSPSEFEPLKKRVAEKEGGQWTWEADPTLTPGAVRFEADWGGLVFQPESELQKLDELIARETP